MRTMLFWIASRWWIPSFIAVAAVKLAIRSIPEFKSAKVTMTYSCQRNGGGCILLAGHDGECVRKP